MKTPMHVHNGVLTKIPIRKKLPVLSLSVLVMELPEVAFAQDELLGVTGSGAHGRNVG